MARIWTEETTPCCTDQHFQAVYLNSSFFLCLGADVRADVMLMAQVHTNWPFVPVDHLKQCLILLGTVLIPVRRANSSPNTPLP